MDSIARSRASTDSLELLPADCLNDFYNHPSCFANLPAVRANSAHYESGCCLVFAGGSSASNSAAAGRFDKWQPQDRTTTPVRVLRSTGRSTAVSTGLPRAHRQQSGGATVNVDKPTQGLTKRHMPPGHTGGPSACHNAIRLRIIASREGACDVPQGHGRSQLWSSPALCGPGDETPRHIPRDCRRQRQVGK